MHQSVPPVSDEAKRLAGIAASWFLGQQLSAITGVIPTGDDPALIEAFAYAGRKLEGSPASEDPSPEALLATITQDDLPRLVNLAAVLCFGNPLFKLTETLSRELALRMRVELAVFGKLLKDRITRLADRWRALV